jgi:hypothetical protein
VTTAVRSPAKGVDQSERAWWLRALLVFQAPRPVFAALRDDSDQAQEARQEPVTALVLLAAIAGVLTGPTTGRLLDDFQLDVVDALIITFLAGVIYAVVGYFVAGKALELATRWLGSSGSYRRSRHVVAFAAAPLALSLLIVWPVRFAAYGGDVFRSGGSDSGTGGEVFSGIALAFGAWTIVLLVVGVHVVERWSWLRALAACAVALLLAGAVLGGLAGLLNFSHPY